ncbi:hypothetical protein [Rudaeicoccus suwonensis]|uniref:Mannosyltransferase PIG-V n=1 Tax=Rudaeicoccus suwonensis TaxID=657409 RepID=A0A561E378_9MICO|nr:hypothetical protein [Rudaeicoccus suwonensis]TWE10067.1 hypothetical protein BKA23_2415 [Rudaeicoccus suwonensis]
MREPLTAVPIAGRAKVIAIALGGYLLARVVSAVLICWIAAHSSARNLAKYRIDPYPHIDYWTIAGSWDGRWFHTIIEHGYPSVLPYHHGRVVPNSWAFLPVYPELTHALMYLTGGSFSVVGSLFALIVGIAAVPLMVLLFMPLIGARATWMTVILYAVWPASPVLQMTYSESLGMLLFLGILLALARFRWLTVAGLVLVLGLTRPLTVPLVPVAAAACWMRWKGRSGRAVERSEVASVVAMAVAFVVATGAWPAYVWWRTGVRSAYVDTEHAWTHGKDSRPFRGWIRGFEVHFGDLGGKVVLVACIVIFLVALFGPWSRRLGLQLRVWCLAYAVYIGAVGEVFTSQYRFMLFTFPLGVIAIGAGGARRLEERSRWRTDVVFGLMVLGFLALQVAWCWELLRVHKPWSPI